MWVLCSLQEFFRMKKILFLILDANESCIFEKIKKERKEEKK